MGSFDVPPVHSLSIVDHPRTYIIFSFHHICGPVALSQFTGIYICHLLCAPYYSSCHAVYIVTLLL